MCNRFRSLRNAEKVAERYKVAFRINYEPNLNVAPTDVVPIIRTDKDEGRKAQLARFGMIPHWAKEAKTGLRFLNARVETVQTTPAYRDAFRQRRCIIPAEGYYEWRTENGKKQPYLFTRNDGDTMSLAGLWDVVHLGNETLYSFTIITNEPNPLAKEIHDRMPCILEDDGIDAWLDLNADGMKQLIQYPSERMAITPMSPVVNNPRVKEF